MLWLYKYNQMIGIKIKWNLELKWNILCSCTLPIYFNLHLYKTMICLQNLIWTIGYLMLIFKI